jgi:hypothetical protein
MEKMPSSVVVYKRGDGYICDASGCFGGGFSGADAGNTPEEAALFALAQKGRYIDTNPKGGDIYLPKEVREALEAAKV